MLQFSDETSIIKLGLLSGMEGKTFKGISHESSNHCHLKHSIKNIHLQSYNKQN